MAFNHTEKHTVDNKHTSHTKKYIPRSKEPTVKLVFTKQWSDLSFSKKDIPVMLSHILGKIWIVDTEDLIDGRLPALSFKFTEEQQTKKFLDWIANGAIFGGVKVLGGLLNATTTMNLKPFPEFEEQLTEFILSQYSASSQTLDLSNFETNFLKFLEAKDTKPQLYPNLTDRFFCGYIRQSLNSLSATLIPTVFLLNNNMITSLEYIFPLDNSHEIRELNLDTTMIIGLYEYRSLGKYLQNLNSLIIPEIVWKGNGIPNCNETNLINYICYYNKKLNVLNGNSVNSVEKLSFEFIQQVDTAMSNLNKITSASLRYNTSITEAMVLRFHKNLVFAWGAKDSKSIIGLQYAYHPTIDLRINLFGEIDTWSKVWFEQSGNTIGIDSAVLRINYLTDFHVNNREAKVVSIEQQGDKLQFIISADCYLNKEPVENKRSLTRKIICEKRGDFYYIILDELAIRQNSDVGLLRSRLMTDTKLHGSFVDQLISTVEAESGCLDYEKCIAKFEEFKDSLPENAYV